MAKAQIGCSIAGGLGCRLGDVAQPGRLEPGSDDVTEERHVSDSTDRFRALTARREALCRVACDVFQRAIEISVEDLAAGQAGPAIERLGLALADCEVALEALER
jgi:hypothetical protein